MIQQIDYTDEFEQFLKEECEKMECLSILHNYESKKKIKRSNYLGLPVIIMSGSTGILAASSILTFPHAGLLIGGLNIITGIIKTIDTYFNYSKISETHRLVSLNYTKLMKFIQVQLSLERDSRINAYHLLDNVISDLDNLRTSEPIISNEAIENFKNTYPGDKYKNVRPSILNGLTDIKINKKTLLEFRRSHSSLSVETNPLGHSP